MDIQRIGRLHTIAAGIEIGFQREKQIGLFLFEQLPQNRRLRVLFEALAPGVEKRVDITEVIEALDSFLAIHAARDFQNFVALLMRFADIFGSAELGR